MTFKTFITLISISLTTLFSQSSNSRPVSTYSIVAYDEETGQIGVAVQSHWFAVGQLVPWAKAGVGAVVTQSFVRVEYGPDGLTLMEEGVSAEDALARLLADDPQQAVRQVAMIDVKGSVAAHTGERCIDMAGHQVGKNFSVQANLMEKKSVWPAMAEAFENSNGNLADRMLAALESAEAEGGDIRGRQSATMLIVSGKPTGIDWQDIVLDLRVDDSPEPLVELRRLLRIHRAYEHANQGDYFMEENLINEALEEYRLAAEFYPENVELPYWSAVALAGIGRTEEALPIFYSVFSTNPNLRTMTPRLVKAGLLPDDPKLLDMIIKQ